MFYEVDNAALAPIFTHFKPLLGILVLGSILLNFKGRKSQIAIAITALALIFLLMSVYASIDIIPTWMVYSAFFIGAWYNGNFEYFYRFINKRN